MVSVDDLVTMPQLEAQVSISLHAVWSPCDDQKGRGMAELTQKFVDGIAADGVFWDDASPGLGFRVRGGKRSWICRFRVGGVQKQKSLPGQLALKKARQEHLEIRNAANRGKDIIAEERAVAMARQAEIQRAKDRTLGKIIPQYIDDAKRRLRKSSLRCAHLYLTKHWASLHEQPADEIARKDIIKLLERYAGRRTALQMLLHLSACLTWACKQEILARNVCANIEAPFNVEARERYLKKEEIKKLWKATDGSVDPAFCAVVRLLLLTGQRRGEIAGLQRDEIDLDSKLIRLPGARTKNGKPHQIPLSDQALHILQEVGGNAKAFFNGSMSSRAKARLDDRCKFETPFVIHDLRRTAVTGMADIGIAPHIIEAVVNHVSGHKAGVAGIYNRSGYENETRIALQRWADHVESLVTGDSGTNVLQFVASS